MEEFEINERLAEYMGFIYDDTTLVFPIFIKGTASIDTEYFTRSIDNLIPIWKKLFNLEMTIHNSNHISGGSYFTSIENKQMDINVEGQADTFEEAAAKATVYVIMELADR